MPRQAEETYKYEDFLGWTTTSLKDYLSLRGLSQSGKKEELVARAFGAYELNAPKFFSQEQIYSKIKEEYNRRLNKHEIKIDPNAIPDKSWKDNVQEWSDVDDGVLFSYILKVKAVDTDYIGKYKDEKAYSYWMSGFVDTIFVTKCDKFILLKGGVSPSQRIRDDPFKVWVATEGKGKDCRIVTSWCTCIAGTGEVCNHVIALLYKVNYAFKKHYISPACTSVPQGWNKGTRKEVKPSRIIDLVFCKHKKSRKQNDRDPAIDQVHRKYFDPRKPEDRILTNERVSSLLNAVKISAPSACVLDSIEHGKDDGLPLPFTEKALNFMSKEANQTKTVQETGPNFLEENQLTPKEVQRIEVETRGQCTNPMWKQHRAGRVTASNFHAVSTKSESLIKSRGKKKVQYSTLVSNIIGEAQDISHLPQIKWGNEHEKDAIKAFLSDIASQHENGMEGFRESGLHVKRDYPFLAGSPDGMFACKCCSPATIEVKCPYAVRKDDLHQKDVYKKVDFLEERTGKPRLKRTHKYYTQVQAQMWVSGVDHCYFIVWTEGHRPLYERVQFDPEFCDTVVNRITLFYKAFVLPCLLGYRDIIHCPKCNKVILEQAEINSEIENSIQCDHCSAMWHLPCAGMTEKSVTAESWLCHICLVDGINDDSDSEESNDSDDNNDAADNIV